MTVHPLLHMSGDLKVVNVHVELLQLTYLLQSKSRVGAHGGLQNSHLISSICQCGYRSTT